MLDRFKQHPAIAPLIAGGETIEYAAHLIPELMSTDCRSFLPMAWSLSATRPDCSIPSIARARIFRCFPASWRRRRSSRRKRKATFLPRIAIRVPTKLLDQSIILDDMKKISKMPPSRTIAPISYRLPQPGGQRRPRIPHRRRRLQKRKAKENRRHAQGLTETAPYRRRDRSPQNSSDSSRRFENSSLARSVVGW